MFWGSDPGLTTLQTSLPFESGMVLVRVSSQDKRLRDPISTTESSHQVWCYVSPLDLEDPSPLSPQGSVGAQKPDGLHKWARDSPLITSEGSPCYSD